ncbi:hypothetical protein [Streptomyces sp. NPDC055107]
MSHDYAAIVSTLIVALLTIGTVQLVTLLKRFSVLFSDLHRGESDARRRITEALKEGQIPDPDDFEKLSVVRPARWILRMATTTAAPYLASGIWGGACVVLVHVQVQVLRWAGTDQAGDAPELAEQAFLTIMVCGSLMVVEGVIRAAVIGLGGLHQDNRDYKAAFSVADRAAFFRSVSEYRRSLRATQGDSAPSPPAGVE